MAGLGVPLIIQCLEGSYRTLMQGILPNSYLDKMCVMCHFGSSDTSLLWRCRVGELELWNFESFLEKIFESSVVGGGPGFFPGEVQRGSRSDGVRRWNDGVASDSRP